MTITIALVLIFLIINSLYFFGFIEKKRKDKYSHKEKLLKNGFCVILKSNQLSVKSRRTERDIENNSSIYVTSLDSLYGKDAEVKREAVDISVLVYTGHIKNVPVRFVSQPIYEDKVEIEKTIASMGEIRVFVNFKDFNDYFFDIEHSFGSIM